MREEREDAAMRALFTAEPASLDKDPAFVRGVMQAVERDRAASRRRFNQIVLAASIIGIVLYAPHIGGLLSELAQSLGKTAPAEKLISGLGGPNFLLALAALGGGAAFLYAERA